MTGIRSALFGYLAALESLTGGEGGGALGLPDDPRIYPHGAPARSPMPYVVYKRSDTPEARTLSRVKELRGATFDFEVWGDDVDQVEEVVEALRAALEDARGDVAGVSIRSVELQGEVDDAVRPEDGSEVTWFVTILTARLTYVNLKAGA